MKCFECKNKTDLYMNKDGILIVKSDKSAKLSYTDIAMVTIPRRKKMTIITVDHRMYVINFYDLLQLDVAIKAFQEVGVDIKIFVRSLK